MFKWLRKTALWIVAVPMLCYFLGAASNQLVLVANHDKFPVMWSDAKVALYRYNALKAMHGKDKQAVEHAMLELALLDHGFLDDVHCLMTPETHLNFLADWIDLDEATYSPGDMLLMLSELGIYAIPVWFIVVIGRLNKRED